jgi:hypothetical protein
MMIAGQSVAHDRLDGFANNIAKSGLDHQIVTE